ncbi:MAG: F0F1 ATP synthase subunit A [Bacteroidales bacterium]|jgi:F-type H+-transporting ATPase subunit a|nr:F0F1 ATP synthase subunit A [Bacteroidales bacterium]
MATQKGIIRGGITLFFVTLLLFGFTRLSAEEQIDGNLPQISEEVQEEIKEAEFNAGEVIIGHIVDAYEWHIADWGNTHLSIPLPVILYDQGEWHFFMSSKFHHGKAAYKGFEISTEGMQKGKIVRKDANGDFVQPIDLSLTKNSLGVLIHSLLIILIFLSVAKAYRKRERKAPKGFQSLIEPLILFIRDDIARPSIGKKHYERFLPYLLTVFFFIFFNNLFGLIPIFPFGANVTGSIAVTGVLALFTLLVTTFSGNKNYYAHIFNTPGVPWWLKLPLPLMPIIELVGVFTKPFVLMVRLFANITAGHTIILGFISLIFVFGQASLYAGYGMSVLSITMSIFINFLELLVAFIQAYVFTLLSAIFFGMAVEEHH